MEQASAAARVVRPIDVGLLAAAAQRAADEVETHEDLAKAIEAATNAFYEAVAGAMPSVFVLEHGRLWLIAQRGYAVVPDGITVESGIIGRAVRLSRAQLASDVHADPDYVQALPGVVSELAIPLRAGRVVVGVLNIESERALPDGAAEALRPLVRALGPLAGAAPRQPNARPPGARSALRPSREPSSSGATSQRSPRRPCHVYSPSRRRESSYGAISGRRPSSHRGRRRARLGRRSRSTRSNQLERRRTRAWSSRCCSWSEEPLSSGFRCARTPASWARWWG